MRLETRPLPHLVNHRMAHPQVLPQSSGAPVRRTVRRLFPCLRQDPRLHRRCQNRRRPALRLPRREGRHAAFTEPLVPLVDERRRAPDTLLDRGPGGTRREEEDNPGATRVLLPERSGTRTPLQFAPFRRGQDDSISLHTPYCTLFQCHIQSTSGAQHSSRRTRFTRAQGTDRDPRPRETPYAADVGALALRTTAAARTRRRYRRPQFLPRNVPRRRRIPVPTILHHGFGPSLGLPRRSLSSTEAYRPRLRCASPG